MGSSLGTTDYSVHSLPFYHSTENMAWHKGTWWPLYVKEWYGPRCSQHMFDPYSFCLLVLGLFLHLLWGTDNTGTSGEYNGDSIQNILGDILSCSLGYIVGTLFAAVDFWWLSILWIVISEIVCILYMRDSLVLAIVTLLVHSQRLRGWQCAKIPRSDSGKYFFSRLCWWSARAKTC